MSGWDDCVWSGRVYLLFFCEKYEKSWETWRIGACEVWRLDERRDASLRSGISVQCWGQVSTHLAVKTLDPLIHTCWTHTHTPSVWADSHGLLLKCVERVQSEGLSVPRVYTSVFSLSPSVMLVLLAAIFVLHLTCIALLLAATIHNVSYTGRGRGINKCFTTWYLFSGIRINRSNWRAPCLETVRKWSTKFINIGAILIRSTFTLKWSFRNSWFNFMV